MADHDGVWAGLRARLTGWVLIGHAEAQDAQEVIDALFTSELSDEERLARFTKRETVVVRLAGLPFLTAIRAISNRSRT